MRKVIHTIYGGSKFEDISFAQCNYVQAKDSLNNKLDNMLNVSLGKKMLEQYNSLRGMCLLLLWTLLILQWKD